MASIFDLNSGSSDSEDDVDYVPQNAAESDLSEDDCSDDTELCDEPAPKKIKLKTQELEKKSEPAANISADDVWKNFLKDVETTTYGKANGKQNQASTSNETSQLETTTKVECANIVSDVVTDDNRGNKEVPDKDAVPKSEDTLSKENEKKVSDSVSDKIVPDKSVEPGNETKKVIKEKPVDVLISRPRTGLSSILGTIANKGKKESVLEKSLSDWKSFKEEQGIDKDLETFNKGRSGYIERQRFLQRSDVRSFENEKNIRLSGRKK